MDNILVTLCMTHLMCMSRAAGICTTQLGLFTAQCCQHPWAAGTLPTLPSAQDTSPSTCRVPQQSAHSHLPPLGRTAPTRPPSYYPELQTPSCPNPVQCQDWPRTRRCCLPSLPDILAVQPKHCPQHSQCSPAQTVPRVLGKSPTCPQYQAGDPQELIQLFHKLLNTHWLDKNVQCDGTAQGTVPL